MPPLSHLCMNPMVVFCGFSKWILADIRKEQWVPITVLLKEGDPIREGAFPCQGHVTAILWVLCWTSRIKSQIMHLKIISSGFINVGQYHILGFPNGSVGKTSTCNGGATGDVSSIPGSGRSPEVGNGNPPQYSCLENPMDRGVWRATVHGVTESRTRLCDWACLHCILPLWMSLSIHLLMDVYVASMSSLL